MATKMACMTSLVIFWFGLPLWAEDSAPRYDYRWFYASNNLLVEKNADDLVALIRRAGKSGYNGVVLADYKFNILDRMPDRYFKNVARIRAAATAAKIDIIPAIFPIGYSSGLLAHDPNLAEGLSVEQAPFLVKGREAVLVSDPAPHLVNPDLEEVRGNHFVGFSLQDDPGKTTFADRTVVHHGKVSCRMQEVGKHNPHGHCRLSQRVSVRPHACYRFSCWVKTRDFQPPDAFKLLVLGAGKNDRPLTFYEGRLEPAQDWTRIEVVFNCLNEKEVRVYAGQWEGRSGTLWVDDLAFEELALVNVLRRLGCPFTVTSEDGQMKYTEGKDFLEVRDAKLGQVPYAGEYEFKHPGATLRLTDHSLIRDGDRLRVSWYHPILIHGSQVACCLAEPKVYELLLDQAQQVNKLFKPKFFFMSHDEIRVAGWCRACGASKPGELLADNVARCVEILKKVNPKAQVIVWSDMFDPNHNAVDHFYLVNGTWAGSWKGLPPEVIIANWNSGKAARSLNWFAERGHPQILAGYYDDGIDNFKHWQKEAKGIPLIKGFLYTTWQKKYEDLETYGQLLLGKQ